MGSKRLALEMQVLARHMPQFDFYKKGGRILVSGHQRTNTGGNTYELTLKVSKQFPYKDGKLYVTSPRKLYKRNGSLLNSKVYSHKYHTQDTGMGGCVQICVGDWESSKAIMSIFLQGILWLEAYDMHLRTGDTIDEVLDEWKRAH